MTDSPAPDKPASPAAGTRRRDAEANRAAIIEAATRLLANDAGASVDAIATEVGLSRRALYGHFSDRGDLIAAVVAQGAERFNAIAHAQREQDRRAAPGLPGRVADPVAALARLAAELWAEAAQVHAIAAIALDTQHVASSAAALAPVRDRLLEICEAGHERGLFRTDLPAEVTARLIEEVVRGAVIRLDPRDATRFDLAPRTVLGVAGLSWCEADAALARLGDAEGSDA